MATILGTKKRGQPRKDSERVVVRLPRDLLEIVDAEAKGTIGRPEAIRRIIARDTLWKKSQRQSSQAS